jgi:hypothetical protein
MAIKYGTHWRVVSASDFAGFLRRFPRPLTIEPPLDQRARFRRYLDPTLGTWPHSQVATAHRAHKATVHVVRIDVLFPYPTPAERAIPNSE